jgi:hypothetical protein
MKPEVIPEIEDLAHELGTKMTSTLYDEIESDTPEMERFQRIDTLRKRQ